MAIRIPWDKHEVVLLFDAYERIQKGEKRNVVAAELSEMLRSKAIRAGLQIEDVFRNINGMLLFLGRAEYIYTDGKKGLPNPSKIMLDVNAIRTNDPILYERLRKEAYQMAQGSALVEQEFFQYMKSRTMLSEDLLRESLERATSFCELKKPLLGTINLRLVEKIQRSLINNPRLVKEYRKEVQSIRFAVALYASFLKNYKPSLPSQKENQATDQPQSSKVKTTSIEKHTIKVETLAKTGQDIAANIEAANQTSAEWIICELQVRQIPYVDKRAADGCLWIATDTSNTITVEEAKKKGYRFFSKASGCRAFPNRPVMWTKDRPHKVVVEGETSTVKLQRIAPANFMDYLRNEMQMAEATSRSYASAITNCEDFAKKHGLPSWQLYVTNKETVQDTIDCLYASQEFIVCNKQQHNRFRAALQKLNLFISDEKKTAASQHSKQLTFDSVQLAMPEAEVKKQPSKDPRWVRILEENFADGYALDDFICQLQADSAWQDKYGEPCPVEGSALDYAIRVCGTVRDGRVYPTNNEDEAVLANIANEVAGILQVYSCAYASSIYDRHRESLNSLSIYTDKVMTEQLLSLAENRFRFAYGVMFVPMNRTNSYIAEDCENLLRQHGGSMTDNDMAEELWFIPRGTLYNKIVTDKRIVSLGEGQWMLIDHAPITKEDADAVGHMLEEQLSINHFVHYKDLPRLIRERLPRLTDGVDALTEAGLFNVLIYHLRERFSFSGTLISAKGEKVDNSLLFRTFASNHQSFTYDELDTLSKELGLPYIYWSNTFAGGAVRISEEEFVHHSRVRFDVEAIDQQLNDICAGDYLSLQAVPTALYTLFPSCGYPWNEYLLLSYLFSYSKEFALSFKNIGKKGVYGAMVRCNAKGLTDYTKLVIQVLTDDDGWNTVNDALDILVRDGYQARRSLAGIEALMLTAKQNKLQDRT